MKKNFLVGLVVILVLCSAIVLISIKGQANNSVEPRLNIENKTSDSMPLLSKKIPEEELRNMISKAISSRECKMKIGIPTFNVIGQNSKSYIYLYDGNILSLQDKYVGFSIIFNNDRSKEYTPIQSNYRCISPARPKLEDLITNGMALKTVKEILGTPAIEMENKGIITTVIYALVGSSTGTAGISFMIGNGFVVDSEPVIVSR